MMQKTHHSKISHGKFNILKSKWLCASLAGTEAGDYLHHLNNDKKKHHSQDFPGTRLFSSQTLEN